MEVWFFNESKIPLYITDSRGTSWTYVNKVEIPPNNSNGVCIAEMEDPGIGDNWGWIYVSLDPNSPPLLQLYVLEGAVMGIYGYAVQYYDGGENTSTTTIVGSRASTSGNQVFLMIDSLQPNWMAPLRSAPQPRHLHQITIPGTHDSGTYTLAKLSWCQTMTIEEQLLHGVRYFDIRVDASTKNLHVVHGGTHGSGNTRYNLPDVLTIFRDFLRATEETVIMQLKADRGDDSGLHAKVISFMDQIFSGSDKSRLWLTPIRENFNPIPTIKDLKGKMVLLRRYSDSVPDHNDAGTAVREYAKGTDYNKSNWSLPNTPGLWPGTPHFEWPDGDATHPGDNISYFAPNHVFNPADRIIDYRNRHGLSFVIQDKYSIENLQPLPGQSKIDAKFQMVERYLQGASGGESADSWYINFSSCSEWGKNPINYATDMNPLMKTYFQNLPTPAANCGFGTVLMDFVDIELLDLVIGAN